MRMVHKMFCFTTLSGIQNVSTLHRIESEKCYENPFSGNTLRPLTKTGKLITDRFFHCEKNKTSKF